MTKKAHMKRKAFTYDETIINCYIHGPSTNAQDYDIHAEVEQQKKHGNWFHLLICHHSLGQSYDKKELEDFRNLKGSL